MDKVVAVLSGGVDSATLLYHLADARHQIKAISVNYGQRHVRELDAAAKLSELAGVEHVVADLMPIAPLFGENSLSGSGVAVPEGHYEEESMKLTVVPNRNMLLLATAIAWAISQQYDAVAYGAHSGDHAIYPDCRTEFADAMDRAARLCDWRPIKLLRPFIRMNKTDIVRRGLELGVPYHLTWTCYNGREKHCGKCGACHERKEAFANNHVQDPTEYETADRSALA